MVKHKQHAAPIGDIVIEHESEMVLKVILSDLGEDHRLIWCIKHDDHLLLFNHWYVISISVATDAAAPTPMAHRSQAGISRTSAFEVPIVFSTILRPPRIYGLIDV